MKIENYVFMFDKKIQKLIYYNQKGFKNIDKSRLLLAIENAQFISSTWVG